jgi:hypothetical protein
MPIVRWVRFKDDRLHRIEKKTSFYTTTRTLLGRILCLDTANKLMNYGIQGSGSDAIKLGVCDMGYKLRQKQSTYRTINLIHDDTVGNSKLYDFDENSAQFRASLEFAINYILRYKFYTPVDQDFCVLSVCGKELFLEGAKTLQEVEDKILEVMRKELKELQEEQDTTKRAELTDDLNQLNDVLQRVKNERMKKEKHYDSTTNNSSTDIGTGDTPTTCNYTTI